MSRLTKIVCFNLAFIILIGCVGSPNKADSSEGNDEDNPVIEAEVDTNEKNDRSPNEEVSDEETEHHAEGNELEQNSVENSHIGNQVDDDTDSLSEFSNEQIEFARVWLQLGPNQEVNELNVKHITAGELINPHDDTSASYPEDVIQLSGSRLVDGSVTYSGNGDGTVNVYHVPLKWESPAEVDEDFMKRYTKDLIESTTLVAIDPGDDQKVIQLIDILNMH